MLNTILKGMAGTLFMLLPVFTASAFEPPGNVIIDRLGNLYQPVEFAHGMHLDMYACSRCHHQAAGELSLDSKCAQCHRGEDDKLRLTCSACHLYGYQSVIEKTPASYHIDTPGLIGAYHLQCTGCHRQDGGPVECTDCHDFTPVGEKFFKVRKDQEG